MEVGRPITWRSGLRTRYNPKSRIGQGAIAVAPWISVVLICMGFSMLDPYLVLRPGVSVDLPDPVDLVGQPADYVLVVLSVQTASRGRDEHVYFDDERYRISDPARLSALAVKLAGKAGEKPGHRLYLESDRNVPHGTIMQIMGLARQAGWKRVALATKGLP